MMALSSAAIGTQTKGPRHPHQGRLLSQGSSTRVTWSTEYVRRVTLPLRYLRVRCGLRGQSRVERVSRGAGLRGGVRTGAEDSYKYGTWYAYTYRSYRLQYVSNSIPSTAVACRSETHTAWSTWNWRKIWEFVAMFPRHAVGPVQQSDAAAPTARIALETSSCASARFLSCKQTACRSVLLLALSTGRTVDADGERR